ncbi:twin transmembrane helix small protein [Sagittula salina]|uniref:Twin transmembrane helix small protein n=1 Tax=Sagittula salina TaxID=2820268 RepID=A0A940ML07_9RHOB|nr:twin transmembrane helix small protein [Sagittula salina]MBP0483446.1 twin transmembrane helix small protein [Sagittula salina]
MADDPLFILIALVMFGVVGILFFGISSFAKGGAFSRKWSNRAMQWRIMAQFVAVVLILLFTYLRSKH